MLKFSQEEINHIFWQKTASAKGLALLVKNELTTPVDHSIKEFVRHIVGHNKVQAVIFYGSGLWGKPSNDTIYDFYVITQRHQDWSSSKLAQLANSFLPPNVEYHECQIDGIMLRAKVTIMSMRQIWQRTLFSSWDTTIWARFSQPIRLVYCADERAQKAINLCVMRACFTSALWAGLLGQDGMGLKDIVANLYQKTYRAELRVEKKGRSSSIIDVNPSRYVDVLCLSWAMMMRKKRYMGPFWPNNLIDERQKHLMQRRWQQISCVGGLLNFLRLVKATYTFRNGARYILWKIARHTGITFELTPFREKHPILASLPILFYLWRNGKLNR